MKNFFYIQLSIILFLNIVCQVNSQIMCGTSEGITSSAPYKPTQSTGSLEVLNILIVYITFPDDNTPDPYDNIFWHWRPHQKPVLQGESSLLASAKADPGIPFMTRYPEYTYSDYFCEMSMGKLDVIGDEVLVDLPQPYTSTYFKQMGYNYGTLNKFILENYVNGQVTFPLYDKWKYENEQWVFTEDNNIEMIVMHYRRIPDNENNWFLNAWAIADLGQSQFGTITLQGKNINGDYNHYGSGVTVNGHIADNYLQNYAGVTTIVEHEISHHFLVNDIISCGINNIVGHSTIGLMTSTSDRTCFNMSPYERSRGILGNGIGYITPITVNPPNTQEITLRDYISTGDVLKIIIPNTNEAEYFFIANHQKISKYDGISRGSKTCYDLNKGLQNFPECPVGNGLYIYHQAPVDQTGCPHLEDAEGRFNWIIDKVEDVQSPFWSDYNSIPIFKHTSSNFRNGKGEYINILGAYNDVNFGQWLNDDRCSENDNIYFKTLNFWGDGLDAYNAGYDEIFSPYSNPATNPNVNPDLNSGITIKMMSQLPNGNIDVKVYFNDAEALSDLPPSNRKI